MKKAKKHWGKKKKLIVIAIIVFSLLYLIAATYTSSDSYINSLDTDSILIDDITGETIEEAPSAKTSILLLVEEVVWVVPVILIVAAFAWTITKLTQITTSKDRAKPILNTRWIYALLASGVLLPLGVLLKIWSQLFPPQCENGGPVLGGPEHCIIGASFGGIVALPLMIVSAAFFVALLYKIVKDLKS